MFASNKSLLFFSGIALGILVGIVFFAFDTDEYFKILTSTQKTTNANTHEKNSNLNINNRVENIILKKEVDKNMPSTATINLKNGIPLTMVLHESDSLLKNSPNLTVPVYQNRNIAIRKDRLLRTTFINILTIGSLTDHHPLDSVLEEISGVKQTHNNPTAIRLEYWQSPVNYKGYKLSANKQLVFGINLDLEIKLIHYDNRLWMKYEIATYQLDYTDHLKPFEKITNQSIIELLK